MLRTPAPEAFQTRQLVKTPAPVWSAMKTKSLLKSENKAALQTGKAKRVAVALDPLSKSQTPAMPRSSKVASKTTTATANRGALQDKTPHANRLDHHTHTPAPTTNKSKKKSALGTPFQPIKEQATPPSSRSLPSATRTRIRAPANVFETPLPSSNRWDFSDGSIDLSDPTSTNALALDVDIVAKEDYDDIEYMPPTAIVPEYDPPFDIPDYKKLGSDLKSVAHIVYFDDEVGFDYHANFDIDSALPSPTTPALLSCASDSDSDTDIFPNIKRTASASQSLATSGAARPTVPPSRSLAPAKLKRPTTAVRPSVVPARAPSHAPARPTAPTPGASRAATARVAKNVSQLSSTVSKPRPGVSGVNGRSIAHNTQPRVQASRPAAPPSSNRTANKYTTKPTKRSTQNAVNIVLFGDVDLASPIDEFILDFA